MQLIESRTLAGFRLCNLPYGHMSLHPISLQTTSTSYSQCWNNRASTCPIADTPTRRRARDVTVPAPYPKNRLHLLYKDSYRLYLPSRVCLPASRTRQTVRVFRIYPVARSFRPRRRPLLQHRRKQSHQRPVEYCFSFFHYFKRRRHSLKRTWFVFPSNTILRQFMITSNLA